MWATKPENVTEVCPESSLTMLVCLACRKNLWPPIKRRIVGGSFTQEAQETQLRMTVAFFCESA